MTFHQVLAGLALVCLMCCFVEGDSSQTLAHNLAVVDTESWPEVTTEEEEPTVFFDLVADASTDSPEYEATRLHETWTTVTASRMTLHRSIITGSASEEDNDSETTTAKAPATDQPSHNDPELQTVASDDSVITAKSNHTSSSSEEDDNQTATSHVYKTETATTDESVVEVFDDNTTEASSTAVSRTSTAAAHTERETPPTNVSDETVSAAAVVSANQASNRPLPRQPRLTETSVSAETTTENGMSKTTLSRTTPLADEGTTRNEPSQVLGVEQSTSARDSTTTKNGMSPSSAMWRSTPADEGTSRRDDAAPALHPVDSLDKSTTASLQSVDPNVSAGDQGISRKLTDVSAEPAVVTSSSVEPSSPVARTLLSSQHSTSSDIPAGLVSPQETSIQVEAAAIESSNAEQPAATPQHEDRSSLGPVPSEEPVNSPSTQNGLAPETVLQSSGPSFSHHDQGPRDAFHNNGSSTAPVTEEAKSDEPSHLEVVTEAQLESLPEEPIITPNETLLEPTGSENATMEPDVVVPVLPESTSASTASPTEVSTTTTVETTVTLPVTEMITDPPDVMVIFNDTDNLTTAAEEEVKPKDKYHDELTETEASNSVTVIFLGRTNVAVMWNNDKDKRFRKFVTHNINLQESKGWPDLYKYNGSYSDGRNEWLRRKRSTSEIKEEDLVYVRPSPSVEERTVYVVFFVRKSTADDPDGVVVAQKIVHALNNTRKELENEMDMNVTRISTGIIVVKTYDNFFKRHELIFSVLLAVALFCICVICVGLIYICCKTRRSNWERNEFGDKNKLNRDMQTSSDMGDVNSGNNIQNEEPQMTEKNGPPYGNGNHVIDNLGDYESWVTPYDDLTPAQQKDIEDTKL